jgi:hypothetical protein
LPKILLSRLPKSVYSKINDLLLNVEKKKFAEILPAGSFDPSDGIALLLNDTASHSISLKDKFNKANFKNKQSCILLRTSNDHD